MALRARCTLDVRRAEPGSSADSPARMALNARPSSSTSMPARLRSVIHLRVKRQFQASRCIFSSSAAMRTRRCAASLCLSLFVRRDASRRTPLRLDSRLAGCTGAGSGGGGGGGGCGKAGRRSATVCIADRRSAKDSPALALGLRAGPASAAGGAGPAAAAFVRGSSPGELVERGSCAASVGAVSTACWCACAPRCTGGDCSGVGRLLGLGKATSAENSDKECVCPDGDSNALGASPRASPADCGKIRKRQLSLGSSCLQHDHQL